MMETLLSEFAFICINKKLKDHKNIIERKKSNYYSFTMALNDLRLMNMIDEENFHDLHDYWKERCSFVHSLFKKDFRRLNGGTKKLYENGLPIIKLIWRKVKKIRK
ncbi:MAG: hypothetical protein PHW73_09110 [Atribacterota bacterium]|nr:hypothetical protein [Atribacterota bacterium]